MLAHKALPFHTSTPTSSDVIQRLHYLLQGDMENLNEVIIAALQNDVELIPTIAKHLILAGGKRIRPLLAIACHHVLLLDGGDQEKDTAGGGQKSAQKNSSPVHSSKITDLAAAIEFIHNATLLHDDVVDASAMRRGRPTANVLWGNKASILVGDFLFAKAFELMLGDSNPGVLPILAKVAQTITEGEVFQLSYLRTFEMTEHDIMQIIGTKTAALFAASCEIGAALLNVDEDIQCNLHEYGYHLGVAFQLIDDVLDYTGSEATLGKTIGDDLSEGKVTLPLFLAYQRSSQQTKDKLQSIIGKAKITEEDFVFTMETLRETKAMDTVFELAHNHAMDAAHCLDFLNDQHPITSLLKELPRAILMRQE